MKGRPALEYLQCRIGVSTPTHTPFSKSASLSHSSKSLHSKNQKKMAQKKKKTTNYQQQQQQQSPAENEQEQSNKINNNNNNTELSQKLARLLSQEPSQPVNSSNHISPQPLNLSDLNLQLKSIIDQKLAIFNEKIKLYQNQLSQVIINIINLPHMSSDRSLTFPSLLAAPEGTRNERPVAQRTAKHPSNRCRTAARATQASRGNEIRR